MNSQVIAVFMIFPSETGDIEINPVSASISNSSSENKIVSNKVKLNVKKLPEGMPEHFKNAVGKFDISVVNNSKHNVSELEKPINISLKISGEGNFGILHLPKILESDDYISFKPKITTKTRTQKNMLFGNVIAEYVVIPKKVGLISVHFEDFSFFDPELKKYADLGSKSIDLNVKTQEQIAAERSTLEKANDLTNSVLEMVNTPILQTSHLKIEEKDKNKFNWKIIIGTSALLMAFVIFVIVKRRTKEKLKPLEVTPTFTTIAETEEILRENLNPIFGDTAEYLKKLKDNKDFEKFFSVYEDLVSETKKRYGISSEKEFYQFLERTKGQDFVDQYRALSVQIQYEKYAPFHTEEHLDELLKFIINIFSEIRE
jgi:hypothetical protein